MLSLTRETLKPFQLRAADQLAHMLQTYPNAPFTRRFDGETGQPYPFICRLKAITGSGKTPMLAALATTLGDAIILWTTNRGAVIEQTQEKLSAGGSYAGLLPEDTQIKALNSMSALDWTDVLTATSGLTILLGTAALFNRDKDKNPESLNLHKDRNGTSYWSMLGGDGPDSRNRPLYVVYDEAHGTTAKQFDRLTELHPRAFVLASASPLPEGLAPLLPGNSEIEKGAALARQTVVVPTPEVVEAGLLKTRLYLTDCDTTRAQAIHESNDKWRELRAKVKGEEGPIWCGIVNKTLDGLEVWATLTRELGVDPQRIAVHLASVDANIAAAGPIADWSQLRDTKKMKLTPEQLRSNGYTHIIWNLSLREGWDEPWAYVAYLDASGKSETDIAQKIGRFVRQPNATPFEDGDLNSAYFYFNVPDEEFTALIKATQNELQNEGYEIISLRSSKASPGGSRSVPVKKQVELPRVAESFGEDLEALDNIVLNSIPSFAPDALKAPGSIKTKVYDVSRNKEDGELERVQKREENAEVPVWKYLFERLAGIDGRLVKKENTRFSPNLKEHAKMKQRMQFGSEAMRQLNDRLPQMQQLLNAEFRLESEPDDPYLVKEFIMSSPDLKTDDAAKRAKYAVRQYDNALHGEYNGLNPFEAEVAEALDKLALTWCRNPVNGGYGIPIPILGEGTTAFYPDFLLWAGKKGIWAIDPKGKHILNDAMTTKLFGVADIHDLSQRVRVAFVVEGQYAVEAPNYQPKRMGKTGCTLIWRDGSQPKGRHFDNPSQLVAYLAKL
ncbi:DEAD/DEAH box helicase family protein [Hymenobacter sp. BT523]|uniref:DEAD/DEAH box helicase family protein n=1 Tax=Hymenobacter sp. BT523 TaxID=2795725 RepID=UPI0018EC8BCF|nr:DEAD/DEAH box helicase family protein [Hymenobacter sp. BT523]MBJ6107701.1 DEAD/DEAH box helicase family protein [Hymenobacter sp. BT523]